MLDGCQRSVVLDLVAYEARARECETAFEMERHFVGGGVAAMQAAHERRKARKRPAQTLDEDSDGGGAAAPRAEHGDDATPIGPPRRVEGRSLRPAPARRDEGRAADGSHEQTLRLYLKHNGVGGDTSNRTDQVSGCQTLSLSAVGAWCATRNRLVTALRISSILGSVGIGDIDKTL